MSLIDSLMRWLFPDAKDRKAPVGSKIKSERHATAHGSMAPSSMVSDATKVLIVDFDGPDGDKFAERLAGQIGDLSGLAIYRRKEPLRLASSGGLADKLSAAAEQGAGWLLDSAADLLVWGEISADTGLATLRLLPAMAEPDGTVGAFCLGDFFEAPVSFRGSSDTVMAATILAAAARCKATSKGPAIDGMRRLLAEIPEPTAVQLEGQSPATTASLLLGLGHAYAADVRCGGDPAGLTQTLACYRAATERLTALTAPLLWAQAENHLATVLTVIAKAEQNPAMLNDAATVYRNMTEALTKHSHPNDWALAQARMGSVLSRLGQMEAKNKHFRDAAMAYEQALTVFTQAAHPLRWADIMYQYGTMLTALGEHMSGTAALEQAVTIFRKALIVRKRETLPLFWAQTATGLGVAAFALAKRNSDAALLREAVGCFEGALEIYGATGQGQAIAVLQKNLQRAQRLLETRGAMLADDVAPKGADTASPAAKAAPPAAAAGKKK